MGSIAQESKLMGQYMHPLIHADTKYTPPSERPYYQPPQLEPLVPRDYPVVDVRPLTARANYSPLDLLQSHGFGVVKHHSRFVDQLASDAILHDNEATAKIYYPELEELVLKTLGAKSMFIMGSVFRQGKRQREAYQLPIGLKPMSQAVNGDATAADAGGGAAAAPGRPSAPTSPPPPPSAAAAAATAPHKLGAQKGLHLAAPVRVPHLDFTPLGARQTIRSQAADIFAAAASSGVLAREDEICERHGVEPTSRAADAVLAAEYNHYPFHHIPGNAPGETSVEGREDEQGGLGPRYAAFSIWRPLRKVSRDPLTLSPRRGAGPGASGDRLYWPYENRVPGPKELNGDFVKEFAWLGVDSERAPEGCEPMTWYYVAEQQPDEVLFIKLFDSASLGEGAAHAAAPWHASPELGLKVEEPRESIDTRIFVFW